MDAETLKKYRLTDSKFVYDHLYEKEWKATELIAWLQGFLDKHGATEANVAIDIDNWYEISVNGLSITADIPKTDEELLEEIKQKKAMEASKREAGRKRARERKEEERVLYEKLHAKYGSQEEKEKKK